MMKSLFVPALLSTALISGTVLAADYKVDPSHTAIIFKINHLGFSETVARFNTMEGNYSYDAANPKASKVSIKIESNSLDSNHAARDKHITGPDFLDVKQYPEITFKSTGYKGSATKGTLSGEFTLHGVTKNIDLDLVKIGEGQDPWGNYRSGFNGTVTLKRSEFGIDQMLGGIGDDIKVELFVEGIRQ